MLEEDLGEKICMQWHVINIRQHGSAVYVGMVAIVCWLVAPMYNCTIILVHVIAYHCSSLHCCLQTGAPTFGPSLFGSTL